MWIKSANLGLINTKKVSHIYYTAKFDVYVEIPDDIILLATFNSKQDAEVYLNELLVLLNNES